MALASGASQPSHKMCVIFLYYYYCTTDALEIKGTAGGVCALGQLISMYAMVLVGSYTTC